MHPFHIGLQRYEIVNGITEVESITDELAAKTSEGNLVCSDFEYHALFCALVCVLIIFHYVPILFLLPQRKVCQDFG